MNNLIFRAKSRMFIYKTNSQRADIMRGFRSFFIVMAIGSIIPAGLFLNSCTTEQDKSTDAPREFKTKTGKTFIINETHPVGQSLSTIEISTKGFEYNFREIYEDADPISEVLMGDLDGNGFDEIYIVTTSAGSGSYGNVLGFASNRDKSLSMINFPEIREGDTNFAGYMGHDTFRIENQKLVRTFPIYREGDVNQKPTGGTRKLIYGLYPGEAMWQLQLETLKILQ